jgi:1,4-alpha-glucan branching enzyme
MMQTRHTRSGTASRPVGRATAAGDRHDAKRLNEKAPEKIIPIPVEFRLTLPGAKFATVAGTFNGWDSKRTPLAKDPTGGWKATVLLSPGRYEYRFVIDGAQWFSDPGARESVPNGFGGTNSVVVV